MERKRNSITIEEFIKKYDLTSDCVDDKYLEKLTEAAIQYSKNNLYIKDNDEK